MSSRRSNRSDRHYRDHRDHRDYHNGYDNSVNDSNIYPRSYAPWQWGYWAADNMAYKGNDAAYYLEDDRARIPPGHFAGNLYDNAGFHGYKHGHSGGSYKLKTSSSEGYSEYPGESFGGHKRSTRRCIVVLSIVGLVFLIGAGLAIGIYFGVVDKPESIPEETTTQAPVPELSADLTFTLGQTFNPDLNDPSSSAYKTLETQVVNEVDESMKGSPLASTYDGAQLIGFSAGSIITAMRVFFLKPSYTKNNQVVQVTNENVALELKSALDKKATSLINSSSIQAQVSQVTGKSFLGDVCTVPSDCAVQNSICTGSMSSVCQCDAAHYDSNGVKQKGVCLPKKPYGQSCTEQTNCATAGSVCTGTNLVCGCSDGKYYNQDTDSCDTKLQQGDLGCVNATLQCAITGAQCVNQRCDCETGYRLKDNSCFKLLDHGESGCIEDADCKTPGIVCAVRVCKCVSGDFYDTTSKTCKTKVEFNRTCTGISEDECKTTNAVCNDTCKCPDNMYLNGDRCSDKIGDGEKCSIDAGCSYDNAKCLSEYCTCDSDRFVNTEAESCDLKVEYNEKCQGISEHECKTIKAVCDETSEICKCVDAQFLDGDTCSDKVDFDGSCKGDSVEECKTPNAVCDPTTLKCKCTESQYFNGDKCIDKIDYDAVCTGNFDDECKTANAVCHSTTKKCLCTEGQYLNGEECSIQIEFGGACAGNSEDECKTIDAGCDETTKTCKCLSNKYLNGDRCSEKTGDGESCTADEGCSYDNAKCQALYCSCDSDRFVNNDAQSCDLKVDFNGTCKGISTEECKTPNAVCDQTTKKCKCPENTFYDGEECSDLVAYDGVCEGDSLEECETPGAVCDPNILKCMCVDSQFLNEDMCSDKVEFDGICKGNIENECKTPNAVCDTATKKCKCTEMQYLNEEECSDKVEYEEECKGNSVDECKTVDASCDTTASKCMCSDSQYRDVEEDRCYEKLDYKQTGCKDAPLQCKTKGAVCMAEACDCDTLFYYDNGECLPKLDNGVICEAVEQCKIIGAACNATCQCEAGKYSDGTMCKPKVPFDGECDEDVVCNTAGGVCEQKKCGCMSNFFHHAETDKCVLKKRYNESCDLKTDCITENADCLSKLCQCASDKYLDETRCADKKPNGEACEIVVECGVQGAICVEECKCDEDEYLDILMNICKPKVALGGDCTNASQCLNKDAECAANKCACPDKTYATDKYCLAVKAFAAVCTDNMECNTGVCDKNQCGCLETQYYDTDAGICKSKSSYEGECKTPEQCDTKNVICSQEGKCLCSEDTFLNENVCLQKLGDGENCTTLESCFYRDAQCLTGLCACAADRFVNTLTSSCDLLKDNGEKCGSKEQCKVDGADCIDTCQCTEDTYFEGNACLLRKPSGAACLSDLECKQPDLVCLEGECQCPSTMYLNAQEQCVERLEFGGFCTFDEECREEYMCMESECACPEGFTFDGSGCSIVVTTTPIPTTPAPDEEVVIEATTELTSNETYDIALADNTSEAYQNKKAETEAALEVELQNSTTVTGFEVLGFEPGSIKILVRISIKKEETLVEAEIVADTPEELQQAQSIINVIVDKVVKDAMKSVAKNLEDKGVFKGVSVSNKPVVIKKDDCENELLSYERAVSDICEPVLMYCQAVNSQNERCSSYLDLLNCIALLYKLNDTECKWNYWRTNLENFGLDVLRLKKNEVKPCVAGNRFDFNPSQFELNSCKDPTAMKLAFKYQCKDEFKNIANSRKDRCSNLIPAFSCTQNILLEEMHCEERASEELGLTMMIDNEVDIFEKPNIQLETCELCLAPNVLHVWQKKCGLTMRLMSSVEPETACSFLHMEMKCLETHLKSWSVSCSMDSVMEMFKTDARFMLYAKGYLSWLAEDSWNFCLDNPLNLGPPEPESVCEDQVFTSYFLFSGCLDVEEGEESCIPFYEGAECVRRSIAKSTGTECSYKAVEKSVMQTSPEYNTISKLLDPTEELTKCIIAEAEDACTSSLQFVAYTKSQEIISSCLYPLSSILYLPDVDKKMSYDGNHGFACSVYGQAAYCIMALFGDSVTLCTEELYLSNTDMLIQPLVQQIIDYAISTGSPAPTFGVDLYDGCSDLIATAPDIDCLSDDTLMNAVTASCALPVIISQTAEAKCGAISECTDGVEEWHRTYQVCPGFADKVDEGAMNQNFAYYFWGFTGFNWLTCFEETETFNVVFGFPDDPFKAEYSNINTDEAQAFIASKWLQLYTLSLGRSFVVNSIFTMEREKRQIEPSAGGSYMSVTFEAPKGFEKILKDQLMRLEYNVVIIEVVREGDRQGYCPVPDAYENKCYGFRDQCMSDSDCTNEGKKCCSDGDTMFCVMPVTEAAEFSVSFELSEESWKPTYGILESEDSQRLVQRYRNAVETIFSSEIENYSFESIRKKGDRLLVVFKVFSHSNPEKMLEEQVESIVGIELEDVFFISPGIDGIERCPDELRTGDVIIGCVEEQFNDRDFPYSDFEVCSSVSGLASCAMQKCQENGQSADCYFEYFEKRLVNERSAVIERINSLLTDASYNKILGMLESYNESICEERGDINPCFDRSYIEEAAEQCQGHLIPVFGSTEFSTEVCRALQKFSSCVVGLLRNQGNQWCFSDQIQETLLKMVENDVGLALSMDELEKHCEKDTLPVCTFSGLSHLLRSECEVRPYFEEGSCSNATVRKGITEFVTCARIQALKKGENCSLPDTVNIINSDRYRLGLLMESEDVNDCVTEEEQSSIAKELDNKESVCSSARAIKYFHRDCFTEDCPLKLGEIPKENEAARCTLLFQQVLCTQRNMKNQSFECSFKDDLLTTLETVEDRSFPLYLDSDLLDDCIEKLSAASMDNCELPLLSRTNGSMECVQHLLHDLSHLQQNDQCKLLSLGADCLRAVTVSVDAACDDDEVLVALRNIISASDVALKQTECKYETTAVANTFPNCEAVPSIDLCDESESSTLLHLVELECNETYNREMKNWTTLMNVFGIDESVLTCRSFSTFTNCGQAVLNRLKRMCPKGYLTRTVVANKQSLTNSLSTREIGRCLNVTFTITLALRNTPYKIEYRNLNDAETIKLLDEIKQVVEKLFSEKLTWVYRILRLSSSSATLSSRRKRQTLEETFLEVEAVTDSEDDPTEKINGIINEDTELGNRFRFVSAKLSDPCTTKIPAQLKRCLATNIHYQFGYDNSTCRLFNTLWHCVKSGLGPGETCDDKLIRNQIFLEMNSPYFDQSTWMRCNVTSERPDICSDHKTLFELTHNCWSSFDNLRKSCDDDAKDEAIKCVEDVINLFGGCDIDEERSKAIEVIIYRSRQNYEPEVEECFNELQRDGFCPLHVTNSWCRVCGIDYNDTCVVDSACPDGSKCCYDGCKMTCLPLATDPVAVNSGIQLEKETWQDAYNEIDSIETNALLNRYQSLFSGAVAALGSNIQGDPELNDLWYSDDGVMMEFEFYSFIDTSKFEKILRAYFEENSDGKVTVVYTNYGHTDSVEREGTCPRYSFDLSYDQSGCCSDTDCNGDMKCCSVEYNSYCIHPVEEELAPCNDTTTLLPAASTCGLNIFTVVQDLVTYDCGQLYGKLLCILDQQNEGRPQFTECTIGGLKYVLRNLLEDVEASDETMKQIMGLFECKVWELRLEVEAENCNLQDPALVQYNERKEIILADLPGFTLRQEFCRFEMFKTFGRFFSNMEEYDLRTNIENAFEGDVRRKRDISNNLITFVDLIEVMEDGIDWCASKEAAKRFSLKCTKDHARLTYYEYQKCRPAFDLFECVKRQYWDLPHRDNYRECLLSNEVFSTDVLPYLESELPTSYSSYLEKLKHYNPETCANYDSDKNPCNDDEEKAKAYNECLAEYPLPEYSSISPEFCKAFYKVSSCMALKLRQLGSACSFYMAEEYVFNEEKKKAVSSHLFPEKYHMFNCSAHKPVCSASFIAEYKQGICGRHLNMEINSCSNDKEKMAFKKFAACFPITALLNGETDCTFLDIVEIIGQDRYKLGVISPDMEISTCISDDVKDELSAELTLGSGLCTSGLFIEHIASGCRDSDDHCYRTVLTDIPPEPACSYLFPIMKCVQRNMTESVKETCQLADLINTKLPEDSMLSLSDDAQESCSAAVNTESCARDAITSSFKQAIRCVESTYKHSRNMTAESGSCSMYKYTLACLKPLIPEECTASIEEINKAYLMVLRFLAVDISLSYCTDYYGPDPFPGCQVPTSLPENGNSCTDKQFVADVVKDQCLSQFKDRASMNRENQGALCLIYSAVVDCGVNATSRFLTVQEQNPESCQWDDVNMALQEQPDVVKDALKIEPGQCTGECFLRMTEVVHNCVNATVGMGYYHGYNPWGRSCRSYRYMYQCVHQALPDCDKDTKILALNQTLHSMGMNSSDICKDPSNQLPLDICTSASDLMYLSYDKCWQVVRNMATTPLEYLEAFKCNNQTELMSCMMSVLNDFKIKSDSDPREEMPCGDSTEDVVLKATLMAARRQFTYQVQAMEQASAVIKACFDVSDKEGACPYIETQMREDISTCAVDTECEDPLHKCCFNSESFRCRQPYTTPESFKAEIALMDVPWQEPFRFSDLTDPENPLSEHVSWINQTCEENLMKCSDFSAQPEELYRKKRAVNESETAVTVIAFTITSLNNPAAALNLSIKDDGKNYRVVSLYFSPKETPGSCRIDYNDNCTYPYSYGCHDDYSCRVKYGANYKCCYSCGSNCVMVEDPDVCKPVFNQHWLDCSPSFNVEDFGAAAYMKWTGQQCRILEEIASCISERNTEMCREEYFSDMVFRRILEELGENSEYISFPKECREEERMYKVVLSLLKETMQEEYRDFDSSEAESLTKRITPLLDELFSNNLMWPYKILAYDHSDRTKRQTPELYDGKPTYAIIETRTDGGSPDRRIKDAITKSDSLREFLEFITSYLLEQPDTKDCDSIEAIYDNVKDTCNQNIHVIFSSEDTTEEKCGAYNEFKDCIKKEMSHCVEGDVDLDMIIEWNLHGYFNLLKEDRLVENEYFNLETEMCDIDNSCWSEEKIKDVALQYCLQNITKLSARGPMSKQICSDVWDLVKCVTFNMNKEMHGMEACRKEEIERELIPFLASSELEERLNNMDPSISLDFISFDADFCNDLVCYPTRLRALSKQDCEAPWNHYIREDNCMHLEMFIGCSKFNSIGQDCTVEEILHTMQDIGDEMLPRSEYIHRNFLNCPVQCFETWKVTDDVQVSWLISSDVNQNARFRIELPADDARWASGRWIGIGISDNTNMGDSDILTVEWPVGGEPLVRNRFATGRSLPQVDPEPFNLKPSFGSDDDQTFIIIERPRGQIDSARDKILNGSKHLLVAMGTLDSNNDLSYHGANSRWYSPEKFNFVCNLSQLDKDFPSSREEVCQYWGINHFHLRYGIMENVNTSVLTEDEKCIYKEFLLGSVNEAMQDFQCSEQETGMAFKDPRTFHGLFTGPTNCNSVLKDLNECDRGILRAGMGVTDLCLAPATSFTHLEMYGIPTDNMMAPPPESGKLLKCRIFEEVIGCYMYKKPLTETDEECPVASYKTTINVILRLYQKIVVTRFEQAVDPNIFTPVDFDDCSLEGVVLDVDFTVCPAQNVIVEHISGACLPELLIASNFIGDAYCLLDSRFKECALRPDKEKLGACSEEEKMQALSEYDGYIQTVSGGYSIEGCKSYSVCNASFSVETNCTLKYVTLPLLAGQMDYSQKCTLLDHYERNTRMCLLEKSDPVCEQHVDTFIAGIDLMPSMLQAFPLRNDCTDEDLNMCHSLQQLGVMECGWYMLVIGTDPNFTCLMRSCFENLDIPEECGTVNKQDLADKAIFETYQFQLGSCEVSEIEVRMLLSDEPFIEDYRNPESQAAIDLKNRLEPWLGGLFRHLNMDYELLGFEPQPGREKRQASGGSSDMLTVAIIKVKGSGDLERAIQFAIANSEELRQKFVLLSSSKVEPSPCSPKYFDIATHGTCAASWNKLTMTPECRHYVQFVSCVWYQDFVKDGKCTLGDVHNAMKNKTKERGLPNEFCPDGLTMDYVNSVLPKSKEDICENWYVNRHLTEYICLGREMDRYNNAETPEKCLLELAARNCVYDITSEVGCKISQTTTAFQNPLVREELLDTETDCDTSYPCARFIMLDAGHVITETCLQGASDLLYLENLDDLMGYSDTKQLKCLVYEEAVGCVGTLYNVTQLEENSCNEENIHSPILYMTQMRAATEDSDQPHTTVETYKNCTSNVDWPLMPVSECPETDEDIINMVTTYCGRYVQAAMKYSFETACWTLQNCFEEMYEWFEERGLCMSEESHIGQRLKSAKNNTDFAAYFEEATDLNWMECPVTDCEYNGEMKKNGEDFMDNDGCNRCMCEEGIVSCTEMACPISEIEVRMLLSDEPFMEDYRNPESQAAIGLKDRLKPWLEGLFRHLNMDYELLGFEPQPGREKRQASGGSSDMLTVAIIKVKGSGDLERAIQFAIANSEELRQKFVFLSSSEVEPSPCSPKYFHTATFDTCAPSWNKLTTAPECRHYVQFVSCVWYQDFVKDGKCTLGDVHNAMKNKTKERGLPNEFCQDGLTMDYVNSVLPKSKEDICENWYVNRHITEYICLGREMDRYNNAETPEKCLLELAARYCVYDITSEVGCKISQTTTAFQNPLVREELLDTETDCDTSYPCARFIMLDAGHVITETCLQGASDLLYLENLDDLMGYSDTKHLKCLVYEEAVGCIGTLYNVTQLEENSCNKENIHSPILYMTQMRAATEDTDQPHTTVETYKNCTSNVDWPLMPVSECPETDKDIINMVTTYCGRYVQAAMKYSFETACWTLQNCFEEMYEWFEERGLCMSEESHIGQRLKSAKNNTDFAAYFEEATDLNWMECPVTDCEYNGEMKKNGEDFMDNDGCNRCMCEEGIVSCTEMACLIAVADIELLLKDEPFLEDYRVLTSQAAMNLIAKIKPLLDALFESLNVEYEIIEFSQHFDMSRVKRQTTDGTSENSTTVTVRAKGSGDLGSRIKEKLEDSEELRQKLRFLTLTPVEPSPCSPEYFNVATQEKCAASWDKLAAAQECKHYVQFVSCVWYQDFVKDGKCTLGDVHNAMKNKTKERGLPNEFCPDGLTMDYVNSVLPKSKEDICENWYVNRHITEYICLGREMDRYNNAETPEKCLLELAARKCVYDITSEVGCKISQTTTAFQNPLLREELLDTETDCDTSYPCARFLMLDAGHVITETCLQGASDLLYLENLDDLMGYSDTKHLKCLVYEEAVGCVGTLYNVTQLEENSCNEENIHSPILYMTQMKAATENSDQPQTTVETYKNCTSNVDWPLMPVSECPETDEDIINMVTTYCGRYVQDAMKYSFETACWTLQNCIDEIYGWFEERGICMSEESHIGQRLKSAQNNTDFAAYFEDATDLNWMECDDDSVSEIEVKMLLSGELFKEDYRNPESQAAIYLRDRLKPWLETLFRYLNMDYELVGFEPQPGREKRQASGGSSDTLTVAIIKVKGSGDLERAIQDAIANSEDLRQKFVLLSSSKVDCPNGEQHVSCFAAPCEVTRCPNHPEASCKDDYCGGCNAIFMLDGEDVSRDCGEMQVNCSGVDCSNVDCRSAEQRCCESCYEAKAGFCPRFERDAASICIYECEKDSECNSTKKCCGNACGKAQCLEPVDADCDTVYGALDQPDNFLGSLETAEDKCRVFMETMRNILDSLSQINERDIRECLIGKVEETMAETATALRDCEPPQTDGEPNPNV